VGDRLPGATLAASADVQVGQLAIAIGSPLGRFPNSVSVGVVSGLRRTIEVADPGGSNLTRLRHLIQTDAAINPGNSGGALVDDTGRVIGINTAVAGQAQGIGFALPIDIARPIIGQVLAGEPIARPWLGIQYLDIDPQLAAEEELPVNQGALVQASGGQAVEPGSPADEGGITAGDIIVSVDGRRVTRDHPLDLRLLSFEPGRTIALEVLRDGLEREIQVTLGARPSMAR
jgi:S1-C subfamily serine protease